MNRPLEKAYDISVLNILITKVKTKYILHFLPDLLQL